MNQKEEVKRLWRLCFDDSEEYLDYYFRLFYRDEVNVSMRRDGELVAALQMLPYPMAFCGGEIRTAYISGACTHPEHRNRGFMRHLLKKTFREMWEKEVPVATLIPAEPWLCGYYARSGFATMPSGDNAKSAYFRRVVADMQLEDGCLPTGMARIIRAEEMLQRYASAHSDEEMDICLTDRQLPANNGYYHLCAGQCEKSVKPLPCSYLALSVRELTEKVFLLVKAAQ